MNDNALLQGTIPSDTKDLLMQKTVLAHILRYVVPEYHRMSPSKIADKIGDIAECRYGSFVTIFYASIGNQNAAFVIEADNDKAAINALDLPNENERLQFGVQIDGQGKKHIDLYHFIRLCPSAGLAGLDNFYTIVDVSKFANTHPLRYSKSSPFDVTIIRFNQSEKLIGIHRLLQIVFSEEREKKQLLKKEFDCDL